MTNSTIKPDNITTDYMVPELIRTELAVAVKKQKFGPREDT